MTDSRNSIIGVSSAVTQYWIMYELDACKKTLTTLAKNPHPNEDKIKEKIYSLSLLADKMIQISQDDYHLDYEDELTSVEQELNEIYQIKDIDDYEKRFHQEALPRIQFLLNKRQYLIGIKNKSIDSLKSDKESKPEEGKSTIKTIFDIGKKFVDMIDDAFVMMRSIVKIPHEVIEAIIGASGVIIHIGEGYEGGKTAYMAYKDENIGQRKTRIATGALSFAIAGAGVGMSIALLTAAAAPLLVVLIPAALTAIYSLSLWRKSYIFHRAKEEEGKAYQSYHAALAEQSSSPGMLAGKKRAYGEWRERRLQTERDVAFGTLEVLGSAMVLVGIILGTAAVVGASVASFGIAPLALILAGVATGVSSKIFENQDEKHHHSYTRGIRKFFTDLFEKISPSEKKLDVQPTSAPSSVPLVTPIKDEGSPTIQAPSVLRGPEPVVPVKLRPESVTKASVASFSGVAVHTKSAEGNTDSSVLGETKESRQQKRH